jgi:hypothetical protein
MNNKYPLSYDDLNDENPWRVPPGYFGNSLENTGNIENFIKSEDLSKILDFVKKINEWDNSNKSQEHKDGASKYSSDLWHNRICSGEMIKKLDIDIYNLIDYYIEKMQILLEEKFKVRLRKRPPVIVCWRAGDFQVPHADKQVQDGRPNAFIAFCRLIKFSSVLLTQISISPVDLLYPLIITAYPPTTMYSTSFWFKYKMKSLKSSLNIFIKKLFYKMKVDYDQLYF